MQNPQKDLSSFIVLVMGHHHAAAEFQGVGNLSLASAIFM